MSHVIIAKLHLKITYTVTPLYFTCGKQALLQTGNMITQNPIKIN